LPWLGNDKAAWPLRQLTLRQGVGSQVAKEFAMRGSTIDQVRHDIDAAHAGENVSEKTAGLQSMNLPQPDKESDHGLWFAIGAGISTAAIAVALAVT
jgi:hypothetical protein